MKKTTLLLLLLSFGAAVLHAQTKVPPGLSFINYDAFQKLTAEVKEHRKTRLLPLDDFLKASEQPNTIILDTRSLKLYNGKHLKGAKHLAFADFTQANLAKIIPSFDTKILIYCNNNYIGDDFSFATKAGPMPPFPEKPLTLALNIPTYINLYGYGYKNVYELGELVDVNDPRVAFEGTEVNKKAEEAAKIAKADSIMQLQLMIFGRGRHVVSSTIGADVKEPFVDYEAFEQLTAKVEEYRANRLLSLNDFIAASKDTNTIILDTRADSLYKRRHIKGAVHLEFSDFTIDNLAKVVPYNKKVLIYCNNNFYIPIAFYDKASFATKGVSPRFTPEIVFASAAPGMPKTMKRAKTSHEIVTEESKPLTLALNIPTFINLVGYGYHNVYELGELVSIDDPRLEFEGTAVIKK